MGAHRKIDVMVTAFRDGFQSVYGSRVLSKDYLPAVEAAVQAGLRHFESGGGASFQSAFFYCDENAFEVMDAFRRAAGPEADLQTLARGISVVGLESQPRDIIRMHAELFAKHGVTTIRNFDALNDVQNLVHSGRCIVEAGLRHEVVVTVMELPPGCEGAHTPEFYLRVLEQILAADIPFQSVCFKDASGTLTPGKVFETVRLARQRLPAGTRLVYHTHDTAGIGISAYLAAVEAGVDQIDLSLGPVSHGTCQPDVVTMWHALRGGARQLDLDVDRVLAAEAVLQDCLADYFVPPEAKAVEPLIPYSPMPGGALTANTQMMRDNQILHRYPEVIRAMGEVVRRGGFGTSVTPVSQFYFQQAFNNVMLGPWAKIAPGYGRMVLGYFGRTPVEPDPEVVRLAAEQLGLEPTRRAPLDLDEEDPGKGVGAAYRLLLASALPTSDENLFIAATCREKGVAFLKGQATLAIRKVPHTKPAPRPAAPSSAAAAPAPAPAPAPAGAGRCVVSVVAGEVVRLTVLPGARVRQGDLLVVQESHLKEFEIHADRDGRVEAVLVAEGEQVPFLHPLLVLA
ncbi:MAG TPA: biotin attachment protein [Myxococcota bacterium]|nr:biotin attachment protein [Myxococcota bacterium]HRY92731.1 biotin attachment protein [Myxococcota bacterium]